jgi:asparagine synthase (glutamine-hydrolysing)
MCGLVGFWSTQPLPASAAQDAVQLACKQIAHRGPDAQGIWQDAERGVTLGHVRLSILDLSEAGAQPMLSPSGRFAMVFNGEIYNHLELRERLEKAGAVNAWRGHSDTETLLACIEAWGLQNTLLACVGMFAICLWDRQTQVLSLALDRFGEKPLYYGALGRPGSGVLGCASELKALRALPNWKTPALNLSALSLYTQEGYITAPDSIYEGIYKLMPGSWLDIKAADLQKQQLPEPKVYWSAQHAALLATAQRNEDMSFAEAKTEVEAALRQSLRGQMMADVPLGAFLSGGIDSSTVVALMQSQSSRPVKTFSIGFENAQYDEAPFAKRIAKHLGTDHFERYVSAQDALDVIPGLPGIYCEPFADSSQIPTLLVSKIAREHVTVALSGDGGDELFGGYTRYLATHNWWRRMQALPVSVRLGIASTLAVLGGRASTSLYNQVRQHLPANMQVAHPAQKINKAVHFLRADNAREMYVRMLRDVDSTSVLKPSISVQDHLNPEQERGMASDIEHMMLMDVIGYMNGDILTKVDRASMAHSLEVRVPILDHRVYELAWRLPMQHKLTSAGVGKAVLRAILADHVPKALFERPKMGFGVPLAAWLRGPLKDWADDLLNEQKLDQQGLYRADLVQSWWQDHLSGKADHALRLWNIINLQAWTAQQHEAV